MIPINVNDSLPPDGACVLAHYSRGNWGDKGDHEWIVAKFIRGISLAEREAMKDCERKRTYRSEDEWANNQRPYCWDEHGPGEWAGQDIDFWLHLPAISPKT